MSIVYWRGTVAFSDAQLTLVGVAWMTPAAPTALGLVRKPFDFKLTDLP